MDKIDNNIIVNDEASLEDQKQVSETKPLVLETNKETRLDRLAPGIHVGKLSDVGREREGNEDSLYLFESIVQHDLGQEPFGLFIVADGMGGHQKGEVTSSLAARISARTILEDIYLPYLVNDQSANNRPLNEVLIAAIQKANDTVQEMVPGGGTTLTMALIMGNTAYIGHVGDTRAYVFRKGELKQITQDHSLAKRLEDTGEATAAEIAQVQNILYKAIGQSELTGKDIDTHVQHLPPGATLMLCSDGLWGLVQADKMKEILASADMPQRACEELVSAANRNGGRDNITVIIISIGVEA